MRRALVTGASGQDGLYLGELLAAKGYEVYGLVRPGDSEAAARVEKVVPGVQVVEGDLLDLESLRRAIAVSDPHEVYNLAALSFVGASWEHAALVSEVNGVGVLRLLESLRAHTGPDMSGVRFFQASSSEMFGRVRTSPQDEGTPFRPVSPYGSAKTFGHYTTVNYRLCYGAFACSGILYNHESERRGISFVTRKITQAVAAISLGLQEGLALGNLEARRDWGFAGDYVEAMWRMLQADEPDDYVIATGQTHSIGELLEVAFARVGIADWHPYVVQDPAFLRPADPLLLCGDASKAADELDWRPTVTFTDMIERMVDHDVAVLLDQHPAAAERTA